MYYVMKFNQRKEGGLEVRPNLPHSKKSQLSILTNRNRRSLVSSHQQIKMK